MKANGHGHAHAGQLVMIGGCTIYAGGATYLRADQLEGPLTLPVNLFIPLTAIAAGQELSEVMQRLTRSGRARMLAKPLVDFGGVPEDWPAFVDEVAEALSGGARALVFCQAGHGRTGTLLASLVARLEPEESDPIGAVRRRYCPSAVETRAQAEAVFRLGGRTLAGYRCPVGPELIQD